MPRAEIFGPQRRSIVSSIPTTTGPSGTNTATSPRSRMRASDRPDHRARLSTPWKRAKSAPSRRPSTDSTAVTVRRPGARTAPVARTRTRSQVGRVKTAANGASQRIRIGGTGSIGGLRLFIADNHHRAGASPWPVPNPMLERIEAFNRGRGGGVVVRRATKGSSLYSERSGGPVARLKPTGEDGRVRVLAWHREKWGASGPSGVPTMTLDRALDYVASNPFFWIHA
jgi:hypothetical protein